VDRLFDTYFMKEIISISANFLAAWSDGKELNHRVEVILITSEPKYGVDLSGELTRQRQTDQYRFVGSPETIRTLGKKLQMLADEAEELPLSNRPRSPMTTRTTSPQREDATNVDTDPTRSGSAFGGSPCSQNFVRMGKPVLKDKYHPEDRLWDEHGQHSKKRREQ